MVRQTHVDDLLGYPPSWPISIIIYLSNNLLDFVYPIYIPVLVIAWILSWCGGVFVTWQRSKVRAVLAVARSAITIMIGAG